MALNDSISGLPESMMVEPGVVGDWSLKDLLAHVSTWEEETLKALPMLIEGKRPVGYHGIDRFNAEQQKLWRDLPLGEVRKRLGEMHRRLLAYLAVVPEEHFSRETRVRHRLRLDTYRHYREHTVSILEWRKAKGI